MPDKPIEASIKPDPDHPVGSKPMTAETGETSSPRGTAALIENLLLLRKADVDALLARVAHESAQLAATEATTEILKQLGLDHGQAVQDIRELRNLLACWRDARRTAWQTLIKVLTTGLLAALLLGLAIKLKWFGGQS